jgi:hypothetical protein
MSIRKLLARVFREMLFDPESAKFPISINELVAPLLEELETWIDIFTALSCHLPSLGNTQLF